jgi:nucleoid-associated protein YgaU
MKNGLYIALLLGLVVSGCANRKKKNVTKSDAPPVVVNEAPVQEPMSETINQNDFIVEGTDEIVIDNNGNVSEKNMNDMNTAVLAEPILKEESINIVSSGEKAEYTVKKGETLMMVAFNVYGDYGRWREIQEQNSGISSSALRAGMKLKYTRPMNDFSWTPVGDPYLIQRGDSLGTISKDKYGTPAKWKSLFENNRPLIKDPNLIFAGFTIYYLPMNENTAKN